MVGYWLSVDLLLIKTDRMGQFLQITTVLMLFGLCVVSGLKCHVCSSIIQKSCGDPFEGSFEHTCGAGATGCMKSKLSSGIGQMVIRMCSNVTAESECRELSADITGCFCTGDLCNNVGPVYADKLSVLLSAALLMFTMIVLY